MRYPYIYPTEAYSLNIGVLIVNTPSFKLLRYSKLKKYFYKNDFFVEKRTYIFICRNIFENLSKHTF